LAASGIADGLTLTTHWQFSKLLTSLHPQVTVKDEQTLICHEQILSCAAGTAWHDLILEVLRNKLGDKAALEAMQLFQLQSHNKGQSPVKGPVISNINDPVINKAIKLINEKFVDENCLEQVCKECALSSRTFQRRFKHHTGVTPITYLQQCRIEKAKELLIYGTTPLELISHEVGYEDSSYLRRIFKRHTNMSLNEYRKRYAVSS
jgi:transcriptional regulator GlxA family with amidase domain